MFETLFTYPRVLRRHLEGPLAEERAAYLTDLAARGVAQTTLVKQARCSLRVAVELETWPCGHCFDDGEVRAMASRYADRCRAASSRDAEGHFRATATDLLRRLGRLLPARPLLPPRYEGMVRAFIAEQRERGWMSDATCRSAEWQVATFLAHIEERGIALEAVRAVDIDAFQQQKALRWSRRSLSTSAGFLRAWLRHCEARGHVRPGLAQTVLAPRIHRHEGLPTGPPWPTVGRMLAATAGDDPASVRDRAIILLLSVYAVRSGEARRLRLDDIDWRRDRIRFARSKSGRRAQAPLEPRVGNAIARYLREARPPSSSRIVFLALRPPFAPLSPSGLYSAVERRYPAGERPAKGRGPHGLRHACARHLLESGSSFKEVGDHLGHRDPDATGVYAKVNLAALRRVAFDDLGGLS